MSQHDELDHLLSSRDLSAEDWKSLAEVLEISLPTDPMERREKFNQEIRHNYGHTLVNVFRTPYDPDYSEIVRATATKLKVAIRSHYTVVDLEDKIITEVLEMVKESFIKEKGIDAWKDLEAKVAEELNKEIDHLAREGRLPPGAAEQLTKLRGAGLLAALFGGKLAGFALYQVANQLFFQIARYLGWRVGVAVAGPMIGGAISFVLGPVGWAVALMTIAYDLGNTNWKKTISAVIMVSLLRRR